MINIQWTKFEQKSIDSFITGEFPGSTVTNYGFGGDMNFSSEVK